MKEQITIDKDLWSEFESAAKKNRRNPMRLMTEYIRETLQIWEHQNLDRKIRKDALKSGYTDADAVDLVKKYRLEKKNNRASA